MLSWFLISVYRDNAMLPAGTVAISSTTGEVITDSAARPVPIIDVAFKKDMWWSIPAVMSAQIYQKYLNGEDAGHTWDWGDSRLGSWAPEGETTSINRYTIDFRTWEQVNIDNGRRRSVRLVFLHGEKRKRHGLGRSMMPFPRNNT